MDTTPVTTPVTTSATTPGTVPVTGPSFTRRRFLQTTTATAGAVAAGAGALLEPATAAAAVATAPASLFFTAATNGAATLAPSGDRFVAEIQNILWSIPRKGGTARPLTTPNSSPPAPSSPPTGNGSSSAATRAAASTCGFWTPTGHAEAAHRRAVGRPRPRLVPGRPPDRLCLRARRRPRVGRPVPHLDHRRTRRNPHPPHRRSRPGRPGAGRCLGGLRPDLVRRRHARALRTRSGHRCRNPPGVHPRLGRRRRHRGCHHRTHRRLRRPGHDPRRRPEGRGLSRLPADHRVTRRHLHPRRRRKAGRRPRRPRPRAATLDGPGRPAAHRRRPLPSCAPRRPERG